MAIDYDVLKEIKERADIVDIISYFLPSVQKKGRNYVCICPFHDDHKPSMQISKEHQTFRCFVDNIGGDVFTFVQKYEKCTFEEAVRKVAEIIGYDDPRLHKKAYVKPVDTNLVPVYNCISEIQKFYKYCLMTDEGVVAREYLEKRQISADQQTKFGLGYALQDGKMTIEYLKQKGFSFKNIEDTGIALLQTSGMSDNNAGRLIFPIFDKSGQVVGFSARKMTSGDDAPKYVNSPETKIFTKGKILYNFNNAKQTVKHDGYIYLVEGFMDVFALDSIGVTSCVALMSTKLTTQHIDELRKLNVEVRVCLDGDKPGQEAMMKIISQLNEAHLHARYVSKANELRDPDEILKQDGPEALKAYVNSLVDPFDFIINYYETTSPLGSNEDKKKVINHFVPMIARLKSSLDADNYIYKLEKITGFSAQAIRNLVEKHKSGQVAAKVNNKTDVISENNFKSVPKELRRLEIAENMVIEQMMVSPEAVQFFEEKIKYFYNETYRSLANFIVDYVHTYPNNEISPSALIDLVSLSSVENKEDIVNLLTKLSFRISTIKYSPDALKDCEKIITEERIKVYERNNLLKAFEGKSVQEQARLMDEYIKRTTKNGQ
ncbi:MAG: DNA primase [Bacilli bacterium]|nr:DNA primase [Bacilli bacterium]